MNAHAFERKAFAQFFGGNEKQARMRSNGGV